MSMPLQHSSPSNPRAYPAGPIAARRYRGAGERAYVAVKAHDACDTNGRAIAGEAKAARDGKILVRLQPCWL
jgi:hypothetical protein